jgi:hypothetical protein
MDDLETMERIITLLCEKKGCTFTKHTEPTTHWILTENGHTLQFDNEEQLWTVFHALMLGSGHQNAVDCFNHLIMNI